MFTLAPLGALAQQTVAPPRDPSARTEKGDHYDQRPRQTSDIALSIGETYRNQPLPILLGAFRDTRGQDGGTRTVSLRVTVPEP